MKFRDESDRSREHFGFDKPGGPEDDRASHIPIWIASVMDSTRQSC